MKNETITADIDISIPDHTKELTAAEEAIEKFKTKLELIYKTKSIDGKKHTELYEEIVRILDYVGRLSMYAFAIEDDLEIAYTVKYIKRPLLGKKLWLDHYDSIHHPYSLLKNRCFRLIDDLDEIYIKVFKKYPPNWNP